MDDINAPEGLFQGGDIEAEVTVTISRGVRRCMATKYAFNSLALMSGAALVLERDFDATVRFIRYGETPGYALVRERVEPIRSFTDDGIRCLQPRYRPTVWIETFLSRN